MPKATSWAPDTDALGKIHAGAASAIALLALALHICCQALAATGAYLCTASPGGSWSAPCLATAALAIGSVGLALWVWIAVLRTERAGDA